MTVISTINLREIAETFRKTIERGLPQGVRYMLVLTDYETLGIDGSLPAADMVSACVQVAEHMRVEAEQRVKESRATVEDLLIAHLEKERLS